MLLLLIRYAHRGRLFYLGSFSGVSLRNFKRSIFMDGLERVARYIRSHECKNIIVMNGAGVSVSAGIPDFRSPGTGLYDNLQKYNLPRAESIFELAYFRQNPKAFCTLAKELFPGEFRPTLAHSFVALLHSQGRLLRCYTQNIDGLELEAGLPAHILVQAHGGFQGAHCIECGRAVSPALVKEIIMADGIPYCSGPGNACNGLVKPDIVFFGEQLPLRFHELVSADFPRCDLLVVMGTSLAVQPFASLVGRVPDSCPRLLINLERVGEDTGEINLPEELVDHLLGLLHSADQLHQARGQQMLQMLRESKLMTSRGGFCFEAQPGKLLPRDIFCQASTDAGCERLASLLGWGASLKEAHKRCANASHLQSKLLVYPKADRATRPCLKDSETELTVKKIPSIVRSGKRPSCFIRNITFGLRTNLKSFGMRRLKYSHTLFPTFGRGRVGRVLRRL
jgi:NAD-dependent deacetylase sirtuin 2